MLIHTQKYSYRIFLEKKSHPCINFSAHEINEKRITKHPHMDHTNHIMLTKKKKHIKHENHSNKHLNNTNEKK